VAANSLGSAEVIDLIALTEAMVTAFRNIPELVAALDGKAENIASYIDVNPDKNSVAKAIYQMPPGSVLVIWQETLFAAAEIGAWLHRYQYFVRARRGATALDVINKLVNGVPNPGDGLRWRFCPLLLGVLPTNITEIARITDEEGIDYFAITTETQETGDA
jgi:hypothetical protein